MVTLRQKRSSDDFEEMTTDDSDYEYPYTRNQANKFKGKIVESSKLNSNSMSIKKAKFSCQFSNSDYEKISQATRRPKCFSKNALMARENRIKKKLYLQNLEQNVEKYRDENKKLSSILDNQSSVISDLRKEVKYLKNVLANKTDISKLLRCINQNTGMPIATSINNNVKFAVPEKINPHPWTDDKLNFDFNELNGEFTLLSDFANDSKLDDLFSDLPSSLENEDITIPEVPLATEDHTYTNSFLDTSEEFGVCLHIAKHKVSLEFCSSCSENASAAWNED